MSHPTTLKELFAHIEHYEPEVYFTYVKWFSEADAREIASQSRVERLEAALQKILGQTSVHMSIDDAPKVLRDDLNIINLHCLQALTNDAGEGA